MLTLKRTRPVASATTERRTAMIRGAYSTRHRNTQRLLTYRRLSPQAAGGGNKLSWRDFYTTHPAADVFPVMLSDDLQQLATDIEKNGLKVPIQTRQVAGEATTYVIDGRNRLDAMEKVLGWQIIDGNGNWFAALANVPN